MKPGTIVTAQCPLKFALARKEVEGCENTQDLEEEVKVELELRSVHESYHVMPDGGVTRRILEEGEGLDSPNPGSEVTFAIRWYANDGKEWKVEYDRWHEPLQLVLVKDDIVEGLEEALFKMKLQEHCLLEFSREHVSPALSMYPYLSGEMLLCEVKLLGFKRNRHQWELNQEEKFQFASVRKEQGNEYFKQKLIFRAINRWEQALEFIQYETVWKDDDLKGKYSALKLACHNNMANAFSYLKNYQAVIEQCQDALQIDGNCIKALLRRAKAYIVLKYPESALSDIERLQTMNLTQADLDSVNAITQAATKILNAANVEQRKMFGGIFTV